MPKEAIHRDPTYKTFYTPDSVTLDRIEITDQIDQLTAIKLIVNSHKIIKADYLNYMMETYKTINPLEANLEPMFDGEHIGKFIVWQYSKNQMEGFHQIFGAINKIYYKGNEDTKLHILRYSIFQGMIYEARELEVNYNVAFIPWLKGSGKEFYDLLDEMETGRS